MGRYALAVLVSRGSRDAPCLGAADGGYMGSRACAGCHRKIYERYPSVAMSHSMSLANQAAPLADGPVTVFSAKLNRSFRSTATAPMCTRSNRKRCGGQTVFKTVHSNSNIAVGSGVNGYSYAVRRGELSL